MRHIIDLAIKIPNPDMFTKFIEPLFLNFLKDRASAIR